MAGKNGRTIACNCKLIEVTISALEPLVGTPGWDPQYLESDTYMRMENKMKELPFDTNNWESL